MEANDTQQDEKSRSQVKREYLELKELGKQLSNLSEGQLRAMLLSEKTLAAALASKGMTRAALQRQYKYLASLVAEEDVDALRAALRGAIQPHLDGVAAQHELEHWRDDLLSGGEDQVAAFVERYPECDRAHLRRLVRNAKKEREAGKSPSSARKLFRYLRELSEQADGD